MRRRRFVPAAALAALVLVGCARAGPPPDSGVTGIVRVGPMCPVVQEGVDCPDSPLEADLEVRGAAGTVIARGRSGAD